jgi:hypothetical protein
MRSIATTGSDTRLDCARSFDDPINPLPEACPVCHFPDLDHVPQPYYLVKSRTRTPNELVLAAYGNFLVRDRIRRLLEAVAPQACDYYPTTYANTQENTPWTLAVPRHIVQTGQVKPSIQSCPQCGRPVSSHPGTQWEAWNPTPDIDSDIAKSSNWASSERGWRIWLAKDLLFSARLYQLLKELKAKGIDRSTWGKTKPIADEVKWVKARLLEIEENKALSPPQANIADDAMQWFNDYLDKNSRKRRQIDFAAFESEHQLKLPTSYKQFMAKVGPKVFAGVDSMEDVEVKVLAPDRLDLECYRKGKINADDQESNAVDGVMFAQTQFGDCYCFDLSQGNDEYPVYVYLHEMNCFEPFAANFVECLRRFTQS